MRLARWLQDRLRRACGATAGLVDGLRFGTRRGPAGPSSGPRAVRRSAPDACSWSSMTTPSDAAPYEGKHQVRPAPSRIGGDTMRSLSTTPVTAPIADIGQRISPAAASHSAKRIRSSGPSGRARRLPAATAHRLPLVSRSPGCGRGAGSVQARFEAPFPALRYKESPATLDQMPPEIGRLPSSQYAGFEGCAGRSGTEPHA